MKYLAVLAVLVLGCQQVVPQEKPKIKKTFLYKEVMVCPKGKKLYIKMAIPESGKWFYLWWPWDGDLASLATENPHGDPACFRGIPPAPDQSKAAPAPVVTGENQ